MADNYDKWFKHAHLREMLNKQDKKITYESYFCVIDDAEEYEQVTQNEMADAIIEFYKVPENILANGEEYEVYDAAMLSQGLLDGRLFFTSLIKVNNFIFACEYGFPMGAAKNGGAKKCFSKIKKLADEMSYIKNKETRMFLAAYLVNKEDGEGFLKLAL